MYKTEASAVSLATASLIASEKGVLPAARKSSVAPNVKQQHETGLSDVPKVHTLHVTECRPYLPFGSESLARKEIESALKAFAFIEKKEGMGRIRKGDFNWKPMRSTHLD